MRLHRFPLAPVHRNGDRYLNALHNPDYRPAQAQLSHDFSGRHAQTGTL
jgi:hypothetical protein